MLITAEAFTYCIYSSISRIFLY